MDIQKQDDFECFQERFVTNVIQFKQLVFLCACIMLSSSAQLMYEPVVEAPSVESQSLISQMQKELFTFLKVEYKVNNIYIAPGETIHTIFVPSTKVDHSKCQNFYVSHGFGGTALMSFPIIAPLLDKGNVIFWEIRGMGFSSKLERYPFDNLMEIQRFFLKSIQPLLMYYKHNNCTFIGHSFSSYLLLLFCIRSPAVAKAQIKKMVLLSAIGITTKQEDYKNEIHGIGDIFQTLLNKFGWAFSLTYKSPLRTICSCCKDSLIKNSLKDSSLTQQQQELMTKIILTLILIPDGSESLFFKFFQPKVLPKIALQPLVSAQIPRIVFVYGGQEDWVDKNGAKKLTQRFPDKISFRNVEKIGHNIPFNGAICKEIFADYL